MSASEFPGEHPTPTCPECRGTKTRPLDDRVLVCFDCDDEYLLADSPDAGEVA